MPDRRRFRWPDERQVTIAAKYAGILLLFAVAAVRLSMGDSDLGVPLLGTALTLAGVANSLTKNWDQNREIIRTQCNLKDELTDIKAAAAPPNAGSVASLLPATFWDALSAQAGRLVTAAVKAALSEVAVGDLPPGAKLSDRLVALDAALAPVLTDAVKRLLDAAWDAR